MSIKIKEITVELLLLLLFFLITLETNYTSSFFFLSLSPLTKGVFF